MGWWFLAWLAITFVDGLSSIYNRERGSQRKVSLAASAATFACLGWDGTWKRVVSVVPILDVERYPYRFLFVALLFVIVLFTMTLERISAQLPARRHHMLLWMFVAPVLLAGYQRYHLCCDLATSSSLAQMLP